MGLEWTRHRFTGTNGRIDVIQKVSGRPGGVQVGCLAGVDDRTTANGDITIKAPIAGKVGCRQKRLVSWLHSDLVKDHHIDARRVQ